MKAKIEDLLNKVRVRGFEFKLNRYEDGSAAYECRGDYWLDDEGDEVNDPVLVEARNALVRNLVKGGYNAYTVWSEKGWVEVGIGKE